MKIVSDGKTMEITGGGGQSQDIYSLEEQRIGTWINGKPVYQMTIAGKIPGAIYAAFDMDEIYIDDLMFISFAVKNQSGDLYPVPNFSESGGIAIYYSKSDKKFHLNGTNKSYFNLPFIATLKYTKTTDSATIELPAVLTAEPAQMIPDSEYTSVASEASVKFDQNEEV